MIAVGPDNAEDASAADPDYSLLDPDAVAELWAVDPARGLESTEAAARLTSHGPNELISRGAPPWWRRALAQFQDPLIYLLLVAIGVSVVAWAFEGAQGAPVDALVILAIVILNAVLGYVQEARAADAVAALRVMTAARSAVLREGSILTVPSADLVPGDILVLVEGDQVGADARLLSAHSLSVAEAALTGESVAVEKDPRTLPLPTPLGDRSNSVFKGTSVVRGTGRAIVIATGMSTEMGAIATMLEQSKEEPTPLQREIGTLGTVLSRIVIGIAIVVMAAVSIVNGIERPADLVTVLLLGVSLAVAAVPEGLPAILSVVLAIGVQRLAKRNAVVKKLSSVETLGSASIICTDKTGTLTTNQMTLQTVVTASGSIELTGAGYDPAGSVRPGDGAVADDRLRLEALLVLAGGSLANDAQLSRESGVWQIQGDPTEAAFLVAIRKLAASTDLAQFDRIAEVPFSSERKMMSTMHRDLRDGSTMIIAKGAPDILLARCTGLQVGQEVVPLDDRRRARALEDVERLSAQAYRTLGVAYRRVPAEDSLDGAYVEAQERDLVYAGVAGIIDPPRLEAAAAIAEARAAGIRVIMITGDHPATARRIASDLGIIGPDDTAMPGWRIDELNDSELRETVQQISVFARVAPEHKLRIVDALQALGHTVAMTGDGVNDAPALKAADIGIAMGVTGTEVTKDTAKLILADDNFATIVAAVHEGRVIFDNIRKFLRYLLYSNTGEVLTVFFGVVFATLLGLSGASSETLVVPLLATQILWINLITDAAPALTMGVDGEVDDVMLRPPRPRTERAIDGRMWVGILSTGLTEAIAVLFTIDLFLPGGLIPGGSDSLATARTAGFTTLVLCSLLATLIARSAERSAFHRLFSNRWLWGALALSFALQVAVTEVPFLQTAFGSTSLDALHWLVCIGMASFVLWVDEIRKVIVRALQRGSSRH
ncbi:cation-translocating P-type ATPase [soil metagenome]